MKKISSLFIIFFVECVIVGTTVSTIFAQAPAEEFQKRRKEVLSKIESNTVFVVRASSASRGTDIDLNFFYLTGLTDLNGALIIRKPGNTRQPATITVFTGRSSQMQAGRPENQPPGAVGARVLAAGQQQELLSRQAGQPSPPSEPQEFTLTSDQFQTQLESTILSRPATLYMNIARSRGLTTPLTADEELIKAARDRGITFEVKNVDAIVSAMRRIKSQYEIQTLQRAIDITGEALKETMRSIEPGMYEYQLQAIIEYVFAFNNSKKVGFTTICGSGPNSINLHWSINDRQMQDGDVVVCDIGADYNGYTGDLTRTLPVNGKFTPRQKAIYEIVLSAQEAAKAVMKPGMSFSKVDSAANKALSDGLIRLGLIKDARTELRKYYTHGLSHSIGLTVHDVGGLGTLEPGMIITIEPGLYVKEENIGIRIEDDFLITDNGCIRLSENVPRTVADVETLCKEKGLDFQRYLIKK